MKTTKWIAFLAITGTIFGEGCESRFTKSGNALTGSKFNSTAWVQDLSVADAIAQLRGIAISKKLDVLTDDAENGNMLLEYRESFKNRAIPYVVSVSAEGNAASISIMVKLAKGVFTKADDVRTEICSILDAVKGGAEGKALASKGAEAVSANAPRKVDAFMLAMELERQAEESAGSIPLRYKNRAFTLSGRAKYVMKDGDVYRVAFDIPETRDRALGNFGRKTTSKMDISCLMAPSHTAWAIALREGEKIRLTGKYYDFDQFKRVMWLNGCKPE